MQRLRLDCIECAHSGQIELAHFSEKLGEIANLSNIGELVATLVCSQCQNDSVRVFDDNDRLLFDSEHIVGCVKCGVPIPLPRLQSLPRTNRCTKCATSRDEPSPLEQHETTLQKSYKYTCDTCGKPSVRRKNSRNRTEFYGCSGFPECRWTHHL